MDRKQVDIGIMEEVIADRDMEFLQRPGVARRVVPSPVTPRPAPASQPAKPKKSFGRWALGTATVAACVAVGIGIFSISPTRIDRAIQESYRVWAPIRNAAAYIRTFMAGKSDSLPHAFALTVQAVELPNSQPGQSSPLSNDAEINTIIVQPGDTLRQIILRTTGEYNGDRIEQIRELNPDIANLDHIEAGQAIRLPQTLMHFDSVAASEGIRTSGKN